ncbi:hypothetical protein PO124_06615 [Bacillus licheniformis]|nr:hypothetical protein [Bacillus licheniformis]
MLMMDHGESFLDLLMEYQDKGLELSRFVIEITEQSLKGILNSFIIC